MLSKSSATSVALGIPVPVRSLPTHYDSRIVGKPSPSDYERAVRNSTGLIEEGAITTGKPFETLQQKLVGGQDKKGNIRDGLWNRQPSENMVSAEGIEPSTY